MPYQLPHGVSFCWVDARAVFLDLRRDRYLCLAPELEAGLRALVDDGAPARAEDAERLTRTGLLEAAPRLVRPIRPCAAARPRSGALEVEGPTAGDPAPPLVEVAWRLARRHAGGRRTLIRNLESWRRPADPPARAPATASLARSFAAARRRLPLQRACLPDSLALIDFLAARGLAAQLVIGVRLHPFQAHAWVERDGALLSDTMEAIAGLTPIWRRP